MRCPAPQETRHHCGVAARDPLPPHLVGTAFRVSDVEFHGVTRGRLRGSGVDHPFHGVAAVGLEPGELLGACRAFEPLMSPGMAFSHVTALALHGAPLPALADLRLHISVEFPRTPPRRRGIAGHSVTRMQVSLVGELPVVPATLAWVQSAAILDRDDLVAAGDSLLPSRRRLGLTTHDGLAAELAACCRPGATRAAWALRRLSANVDSRPESLLRLLFARARLPASIPNGPVEVGDGIILHGDLVFERQRVVVEYEGDGHRTDAHIWRRDIRRREMMESAGWRVVRVTADDVFVDPRDLISRVRAILAARAATSR